MATTISSTSWCGFPQQLCHSKRLRSVCVQPALIKHVLNPHQSCCSRSCDRQQAVQRGSASLPAAAGSAVSAGAAAASSIPDLDPKVYLEAAVEPAYFVGPIAVANIPGKGRGLVATAPLSPGQLLLVVPPIALLEGELGDIPEHDELAEVISSSGALFTPWQGSWLQALTTTTATDDAQQLGGSSGSSAGDSVQQQQQQQEQPVVPPFLPPVGGETDRVLFESMGMDEERLWAAVVLNCYGEGFADLPASLCAEAPLSSQLGLWGAFSLLNHTCCPNVVNYTLRDCMIVRCCAPVAVGEELSINYLGRSSLTPLAQRQEELEACYGFKCKCRRCRAEAAWAGISTQAGIPLPTFLDSLHTRIGQEFEPWRAQVMQDMQDAQDEGSEDSTQRLQQQAQQQLEQLVTDMRQQWQQLLAAAQSRDQLDSSSLGGSRSSSSTPGLQSEEGCWVLASAFDLLGMLQDSTHRLGQHDPAVLDAIVHVCEVVCPGSDLHVFQALIRTSMAQQHEQGQQEGGASVLGDATVSSKAVSDVAMQGLVRALQLRYGQQVGQNPELLKRMVAATSAAANMVWL